MNTSCFRSSSPRAIAIRFAVVFALWFEAPIRPAGATPVLNCGDPKNDICVECVAKPGNLSCCFEEGCEIVNIPPTTGVISTIHLKAIVDGATLVFQRKVKIEGGQRSVDILLKDILASTVSRRTMALKAKLTGADASIAGLLYPIAFLGIGATALDALHAQGYDVSVASAGPGETCQAVLSAQTCTDLANQLSKGIDASLAVGDPVEHDAFLQAVQTLGYPPCQIIP